MQHNIGEYADEPEGVAKYLIKMNVATDIEPDNEAINKTLDAHLEKIAAKKSRKQKAD